MKKEACQYLLGNENMPDKLQELTECQKNLLGLLFHPDNREKAISGDWGDLLLEAGYANRNGKANALASKRFREELEKGMGNYQYGLQLQSLYVVEDILSGTNMTPLSTVQLAAARDTLDRSKMTKKTEQKIDTGSAVNAVVMLPPKNELPED